MAIANTIMRRTITITILPILSIYRPPSLLLLEGMAQVVCCIQHVHLVEEEPEEV
jgi:hypothetical protein